MYGVTGSGRVGVLEVTVRMNLVELEIEIVLVGLNELGESLVPKAPAMLARVMRIRATT